MNHLLGTARREFRAGEFALVIFVAFSWSIVYSLAAILGYRADREIVAFNDTHLWSLVGSQVPMGLVVAAILKTSGWHWDDFHVHYSPAGTIAGLALGAVTMGLMWAAGTVAGPVAITAPSASLAAVVAVSLVNPWYEELLVCAYVIEALRKRFGLQAAVHASIAIRLSYHLYQGPAAFLVFAVFGLAVTLFYVKTGRLWPVIVAHALLDFLALGGL